jgi:hypothetical protein
VHTPDRHACPLAQTPPQAPQLFASVSRFASHPSVARPLQSPKFTVHTYPHRPLEHAALALTTAGQIVPHAPQFAGSMAVFVHTAGEPQVVSGAPHDALHMPATHIVPAPHTVPQAPQLSASVCTLAQ